MKRLGLITIAMTSALAACATTTVTPDNVYSFSELSLCRIQANPGSRETVELDLVGSELGRRTTDCAAVFDAERLRQEEERRRREEERRIAEEERRIYTERQIERIAMAQDAWDRPRAWRNRALPRNVSGLDINACIRNDDTGVTRPADVEAVMGDALNIALETNSYNPYRQYSVVFRPNGRLMIVEMYSAFHNSRLPDRIVWGSNQRGVTWGVRDIGYGC
ncbi:hypothetical protein [Maricaulis sp.]|uniref:hypothetical protein n=1 Tax=Maricaulis sp. TaxID=1486257 RepID=UPI00261508C2|nr:hypothetical protein [Maricaulis sp.]